MVAKLITSIHYYGSAGRTNVEPGNTAAGETAADDPPQDTGAEGGGQLGEAKEGGADDMDLEDGDALAEFFSAAPTAAPAAATTTTPSVQPIHSMMLVVLNQVADQGNAQRGEGVWFMLPLRDSSLRSLVTTTNVGEDTERHARSARGGGRRRGMTAAVS